MQVGSLTFSRSELNQAGSPCVYIALALDGKILYIGFGEHGFSRVFKFDVKHEGRNKAFETCHSLSVVFFSSKDEASETEDKWIHAYHPIYNGSCPKCDFYGNRRKQEIGYRKVRPCPSIRLSIG
jgi:excinuclease UvrABC nuclease subunit